MNNVKIAATALCPTDQREEQMVIEARGTKLQSQTDIPLRLVHTQGSTAFVPDVQACSQPSSSAATAHTAQSCRDQLSDADYLLRLLHTLDCGSLMYLLLERGGSPQKRWSKDGSESIINPSEVGLDAQLIKIISDPNKLRQTVEAIGVIEQKGSHSLGANVRLNEDKLHSLNLSELEKRNWNIQSLTWICFMFPREHIWDSE